MPAIRTSSVSREGIDIHFRRVFQEPVDEDGTVLRECDRLAHVAADHLLVIGDHHRAAAEHIARAHENRITQAAGDGASFLDVGRRSIRGRRDLQLVEQLAEQLSIFRQVDVLGIRADDRHPGTFQRQRQVQRGLAAELHDETVRLLRVADVEHVFERQRLEVEPVAGVVVGRYGFRVAVDHDRLDAELLQRERSVAAAVVELDTLADAVGSAAQDHDLLSIRGIGLAVEFIAEYRYGVWLSNSAAHVSTRLNTARTFCSLRRDRDLGRRRLPQASERNIRDAVPLGLQQRLARHGRQGKAGQVLFEVDHLFHLARNQGSIAVIS